jgi:D-alanine-D-alanine ligase
MIASLRRAGSEVIPVIVGRDGTWSIVAAARIDVGLPAEIPGAAPGAEASGTPLAIAAELVRRRTEVVVVGLHGAGGEDGTIQGFFETAGLAYTGPGVATSAVAMDKVLTKLVLRASGLPTADWVDFGWPADESDVTQACGEARRFGETAGYPLVVKARTLGSSVGVAFAPDAARLVEAVRGIARERAGIFAEKAVRGVEVSCGVVGRGKDARALPAIEIVPRKGDWFDYESKYATGGALERIPAQVPPETEAEIRRLALRVHAILGADGITRTDMIVTDTGPVILEVNTLPGMTETSLVPQEARAAGWSLEELLGRLVDAAWRRRWPEASEGPAGGR